MDFPAPGTSRVITSRGSIKRIVREIKRIAIEDAKHPKIQAIAQELSKKENPEKAVFDFVYNSAVFRDDPKGFQNIRDAQRTIKDKIANCVDYTILISSLFLNMGIEHKLAVVSINRPSRPQHIYVITNKGIVLDPVIGQKQDGTDSFDNRDGGHFNKEEPYKLRRLYSMPVVQRLSGLLNTGMNGMHGHSDITNNGQRVMVGDNEYEDGGNLPMSYINTKSRRSIRKFRNNIRSGRSTAFTRSSTLGIVAEEGTGEEDWYVEAAKILADIAYGDKCKRKCDFNHPFNKEKRQACKCTCSKEAGTSYTKINCLTEYGIPTYEWPPVNYALSIALWDHNTENGTYFRLFNPTHAIKEGQKIRVINNDKGANGCHTVTHITYKDDGAYWIFVNIPWQDRLKTAPGRVGKVLVSCAKSIPIDSTELVTDNGDDTKRKKLPPKTEGPKISPIIPIGIIAALALGS